MTWETLIPPATAAVLSIAVTLGTIWSARRLGLTDLQRAVDTQTDRLITTLQQRVTALEAENALLKANIERLERRATELESAIITEATKHAH